MALADFLLQRDFIACRVDITKHSVLSLAGNGQTVVTAPVFSVKPQNDLLSGAAFAEMFFVRQADKIHQNACHPAAVSTENILENLIPHADDLRFRQTQHGVEADQDRACRPQPETARRYFG